jgi:hypothetical protein
MAGRGHRFRVAQLKEKSPDREAEALNRSHQLREGTERLAPEWVL